MHMFLGRPIIAGAVVFSLLAPCGALAQEMATPGPFPLTPDPATCEARALTVNDVLAVLAAVPGTPAAATPDAATAATEHRRPPQRG